jgi:hypothetical protein
VRPTPTKAAPIAIASEVGNPQLAYLKANILCHGQKKLGLRYRKSKNPADRFYPISQLVWVGGEIKTKKQLQEGKTT